MAAPVKKVTLRSRDGKLFEVDKAVALDLQTIKHLVEDDCVDNEIPVPNVTSSVLSKVIEYCKRHVEAWSFENDLEDNINSKTVKENLRVWEAATAKMEQETLFDVIFAEDDCVDNKSRDDVPRFVLSKVSKHLKRQEVEEELRAWDADFVKVDYKILFDLILAANYLDIPSLLDLTCQAVADIIIGSKYSPKEIRSIFDVRTGLSPEEEEEIRREDTWAFE